MATDLFSHSEKQAEQKQSAGNVPEMSVGDLANSVKRTLEQSFGRIRVRGEFTGLKLAGSGHLYGDLKDENAVINIVCWRSTLGRLSVKPEDGLEVIITGKVSSYPKSSRYQLIIESVEMAGEGALLKMLEERKKKLAAEGLFAPERKKRLPYLPEVIGVVTSPSGAVIRDIMHRLDDRFPRHVLLWPVMVQGDGAADQITNAIRGFNAIDGTGHVPKPDLLIVARGGGSLEDLMAFNEENVVRAAADSGITLISAVGHETDTTLIDYAADQRAPTPTGAAEMAVPVRADLLAWALQQQSRMAQALNRSVSEQKNILASQIARLGDPQKLLDAKQQTIDFISDKFSSLLRSFVQQKQSSLSVIAGQLKAPSYALERSQTAMDNAFSNLMRAQKLNLEKQDQRLQQTARLMDSLSYEKVLERGFVVVRDKNGKVLSKISDINDDQDVVMHFKDQKKAEAIITKTDS
ncbi:MAG: exodeoxyribonuclease VII large subunit [Pseudomonadota bacterium]